MKDQLKDRIEARKHELLSKYNDLKADTKGEAAEARTSMKQKLDDLEDYLREGWDKMTDATRAKLDSWLDRK